jgi:hypothetical protein
MGYPKSVTFFLHALWDNKSLSMMWCKNGLFRVFWPIMPTVQLLKIRRHNLIINCTSLRHLAVIKCICIITNKLPACVLSCLSKHKWEKTRAAADRDIDSFILVINDIKTSPFFNIFHKILRKMAITTKASDKGQLAAISWVTSDRKRCQTGFF